MINKIVLHVGPYKTGSTSIQSFAFNHSEILKNDFSILYPSFNYDHGPLFRNAFKKKPEDLDNNIIENRSCDDIKSQVTSYLAHMESEINESDCELLFVSGEHISDLTQVELVSLKEYLNKFTSNIEIYYFVREPLKLLLSDLQESVKTGRATLEQWSFEYILPRYYQKLKDLEAVFGQESFHVIDFETAIKYEKGLVQYFFDQVFANDFKVEGDQKSNDSISDLSFKLLEKLNVIQPSVVAGKKNNARSNLLGRLLKSHKGSKINIDLPLSKDFISKFNKTLVSLSNDFDIHYDQIKVLGKHVDVASTQINSEDMVTFVGDLNTIFMAFEKKQTKTIDLLRDSAIALEGSNIHLAMQLMQQAHELRPDGPFINKKIKEYKGILSEN